MSKPLTLEEMAQQAALEKLIIDAVRLAIARNDLTQDSEDMSEAQIVDIAQDTAWAVQGEGCCDETPIKSWTDALAALRPASARKHPLKFVKTQGVLADALGVSPDDLKRMEELVDRALALGWSMRELLEYAGEMDISDEVWATFLYTYGWWDGRRRPIERQTTKRVRECF